MTRPRRLIGTPKRLERPQIRRSARAAISRPPPTQMPWIMATTGTGQSRIAARVACMSAP